MTSPVSPITLAILAAALAFTGGTATVITTQLTQLNSLQNVASTVQPHQNQVSEPTGASLAAYKQSKEDAALLLPSEDKQYDLSVQIEALSKQSGVLLSSLGITAASTAASTSTTTGLPAGVSPSMKRITVTLTASGDYGQLEQFTNGITRLERFVTLNQVVVSGKAATSNATIQVTAFAYYLP